MKTIESIQSKINAHTRAIAELRAQLADLGLSDASDSLGKAIRYLQETDSAIDYHLEGSPDTI